MAETRKLTVEIVGDASKLKSVLADADGHAGRFGSNLGTVIKQGAMVAGAATVALGVASLSASMDFNKGMANVASLIPGNTERVKELSKSVQSLAIETGQSTTDMSAALYQVVSAFGDSADAAEILRINARAAVAGVATTSEAIAITSAVTKSYGDTSKKAVSQVADLATLTVRLGQTTFPELASSIGAVTPLAKSAGVTQKELFAVMATGAGVTGTASEVATQFKSALQGLLAPTKDAASAFKDYRDDVNTAGFASGEAAVKALGVQGALKVLTDAARSSGEPLQKYIASIEGQTLALTLVGGQAENYTRNLAQMADAAGATDAAFAEQTTGVNALGFTWDQMKVAMTVAMQVIGDKMAAFLLPKLQEFRDWWEVNGKEVSDKANDMKDKLVNAFNLSKDAAEKMINFLVDNKPVLVGFFAFLGTIAVAALVNYTIALWAAVVAEVALLAPMLGVAAGVGIIVGIVAYATDQFGKWAGYISLVASVLAMLAATIAGAPLWAMLAIGAAAAALATGLIWIYTEVPAVRDAINALTWPFRALADAVGWVVDKLARLDDLWRSISRLPSLKMPSLPSFPRFHTGGTFLASTPGGEGMALLRDRERIVPPSSGLGSLSGHGGGSVTNNSVTQNITIDATGMRPDDVIELIRKYERSNGASWRGATA